MNVDEFDLEECVYHEVINRPGLLKKIELKELSEEKGGLAECCVCSGYDSNCPDYLTLKEVVDYEKPGSDK